MVQFSTSRFLEIVKMIAPVVLMVVPGGAPFAPLLVNGIVEAQGLYHPPDVADGSPLTGAEKKAHVLGLLRDGAATVNLVRPGSVDPMLLEFAAGSAIDVIVDTAKRLAAIEAEHAHIAEAGGTTTTTSSNVSQSGPRGTTK